MRGNGSPDRVWDEKHQKWIEVGYLDDPPNRKAPRSKRKPFVVEWVKLPDHWIEQLKRARCLATYILAHVILREDFKRQHIGGEVILSTHATGISRWARHRAVRELVALGLIRITQQGNGAVIVTEV
jgi:hypothetical protein